MVRGGDEGMVDRVGMLGQGARVGKEVDMDAFTFIKKHVLFLTPGPNGIEVIL